MCLRATGGWHVYTAKSTPRLSFEDENHHAVRDLVTARLVKRTGVTDCVKVVREGEGCFRRAPFEETLIFLVMASCPRVKTER